MRRVGIRSLNGQLFSEAAATGELIGITNDHRLAAVLLPITTGWVDQVVEDHFKRLLRSVESGERTLKSGEPLMSLDEVPGSESGDSRAVPITRRIAIRELSGELLRDAALKHEILGVLNDGRLCAVLMPVTPEWVDRLIDYNISRVAESVEWGNTALEANEMTALDPDEEMATI